MLRYYRHSSYVYKSCRSFINLYKNKAEAKGNLNDILSYMVENTKDLNDLEGMVPVHLSELRRTLETNTQRVSTVLQRMSDSGIAKVEIVGEIVKLHIPILLELIGSKNNINRSKNRIKSINNNIIINSPQNLDGFDGGTGNENLDSENSGERGKVVTVKVYNNKQKSLQLNFETGKWETSNSYKDYDFMQDLKEKFPELDIQKEIDSITKNILNNPSKYYEVENWFKYLVNCLNQHYKGFKNQRPSMGYDI